MNNHLILFFTRGVSLQDWHALGILSREKLIYEYYLNHNIFKRISWITYGIQDRELSEKLKKEGLLHRQITVADKPAFLKSKIGNLIFSFILPFIHWKEIKSAEIFKTNQMDGSWAAVLAKWIFKKPLIIRTGYIRSKLLKHTNKSPFKRKVHELVERISFRSADSIITTSQHDKKYVCQRYHIPENKIHCVYNYVDPNIFCEKDLPKYSRHAIFIGRLDYEKNLFNLIDAMKELDCALDIYGQGPIEEKLSDHIKKRSAKTKLKGIVSNEMLPEILAHYEFFILPSFHEGMPKVLLEAMACGLVCLATNSSGMSEVIEDGKNGYLIHQTDARGICEALEGVLKRKDHGNIKKNAILTIHQKFSISAVAQEEMKIYKQFVNR